MLNSYANTVHVIFLNLLSRRVQSKVQRVGRSGPGGGRVEICWRGDGSWHANFDEILHDGWCAWTTTRKGKEVTVSHSGA